MVCEIPEVHLHYCTFSALVGVTFYSRQSKLYENFVKVTSLALKGEKKTI